MLLYTMLLRTTMFTRTNYDEYEVEINKNIIDNIESACVMFNNACLHLSSAVLRYFLLNRQE